ncbi:MAG: endo-1,4-beta-xylanase, partial [Spirochaetales bacterium]|nr:endo-1,4-beta-xylanase [Spirochaetales bacterium]
MSGAGLTEVPATEVKAEYSVFTDDGPSLREAADARGLNFGVAVIPGRFRQPLYGGTLIGNFNSMTAENVMKWQTIHPERNRYDFSEADQIIDFAAENGMTVRGHTIIWHNQLAKWVTDTQWSRDELIEVMREHIFAVAGRYKGKILAWDVVNEAIDGSNYRKSLFYNVIGPEYIAMAFRMAHEADPQARLYYNDYGVSGLGAKSDAMYAMVKELLDDGVPIHGVGLQTHMSMQWDFSYDSMRRNMARFVDLGLKVDLTEVDVRMELPVTNEKLAEQADRYKRLMETCLEFPTCDTFIIWGLSDSASWIEYTFNGMGSATIFDTHYQPKPAFFGVREALVNGPPARDGDPDAPVVQRRAVPPFIASEAAEVPVLDGAAGEDEWGGGIVYPLGFNQLSPRDLRDTGSVAGTWTAVYKGNTLYGLLTREDDITYTGDRSSWENDTLEVFFDMNGTFVQLRTLIGQDFQAVSYEGPARAVWSDDGRVCEFSVVLPDTGLANMLCGWNIALSDNDGSGRTAQLYPVNGINDSYTGVNLGSLKFEGTSPRPPEAARITYPFKAAARAGITVDGNWSAAEWGNTVSYPFLFNQLNPDNLCPPVDDADLSGGWGIAWDGITLYGYVHRRDDITYTGAADSWENDCVEVFIDAAGTFAQHRIPAGKDWEDMPSAGVRTAAWSA